MISSIISWIKLSVAMVVLALSAPAMATHPLLTRTLATTPGDDALSIVCKRLLFVDFSYYEDDDMADLMRQAGARKIAAQVAVILNADPAVATVLPKTDQFVEFLESYFSDSFAARELNYKRIQAQIFSGNLQKILSSSLRSCREKGNVKQFVY